MRVKIRAMCASERKCKCKGNRRAIQRISGRAIAPAVWAFGKKGGAHPEKPAVKIAGGGGEKKRNKIYHGEAA